MKIPLCNRCPKPAFLRVDANTVLCAECWNEITARLKSDFESSCGGVESRHADNRVGLASCANAKIQPKAGVAPGPQDSIPSVGDTMDGNATVAAESNDEGIPEFLRRTA